MSKHFILTLSLALLASLCSFCSCNEDDLNPNVNGRKPGNNKGKDEPEEVTVTYEVHALPDEGVGVPVSSIWSVQVSQNGVAAASPVYQSSCPVYQEGYRGMEQNDKGPLNRFAGQSISWTNFDFSSEVEVRVKVLDKSKLPALTSVKILPSRKSVSCKVEDDVIKFTLTQPGQYSVEVGDTGYKNGLMIFANPPETDRPQDGDESFFRLDHATAADLKSIPAKYSGVYFKAGVHDIGVYDIPSTVKNVYFEAGAYVYGSLHLDGNPNVHIFGRGVLSQGRMNFRTAHVIEAVNGSNNTRLEGITIADFNYFSVRLISTNNIVNWIKIIGAWVYHCDGISAYAGSKISNCFIMANDDSIKCYETGTSFTNMVCWQQNNGGMIQLNWGDRKCDYAEVRHVDLLHADWNSEVNNRGILCCTGNKYYESRGGVYTTFSGYSKNIVIEDIVSENPIRLVIELNPYTYTPLELEGITMKDWNIKSYDRTFKSHIEGISPESPIKGLVFQNVVVNGTKLTASNYVNQLRLEMANCDTPTFK